MNANEYLKQGAIVPVTIDAIRALVELGKHQAKELDRAVELYTDKAIENEALKKELVEAGHMIGVLREYISDLENGLDSSIKLNKAQAERNEK